jgi:serine/threonine protein kinase
LTLLHFSSLCASGVAKISDFGVSHIFEDEKSRPSFYLPASDDDSIDDVMYDNDNIDQIDDYNGSTTHLLRRESDQALNMPSRHNSGILKKTEGTWCFWSPEMCGTTSDGFSAYSADLWAAGVCLYIFITGTLPFFSMDPSELFAMISKAKVPYAGLCLSDSLRDLLGKLLEKDPSTRAGVGDCLRHEFCAQARNDRIDELGYKFKRSDREIILSKNEVDMALSITRRGSSPKARTIRVTTSSQSSSAPLTMSNLQHSFDDLESGNDKMDDAKRGSAERIDEAGGSQTDESSEVNDMHSQKSFKSMNSRSIVQAQYSTLKKWCRNKLL